VAVNQATFGEQFFAPSDHDILVNFKPVRVHKDAKVRAHYMGRFRLRAWY